MIKGILLKFSRDVSWKIVIHLILVVICATMVTPLLWMVSTSLKSNVELYRYPLVWIPEKLLWKNYSDVLAAIPLGKFFFNSVFVATVVTLLQLCACAMGAYAFARLHFKGKDVIFLFYLATVMIPGQVTMIPMFLVFSSIRAIDTYWALIIPGIFSAYGTFLLRQFFMGIPKDLENSVLMDGGGYWLCFLRIILPLSKPAFATLGTFTFLNNWNNFMWPLLVTNKVSMKTLPVGIMFFQGQYSIQWQLLMAAATMSLFPMMIVYLFTQKYFVAGITMSGIKG
jgi:multiple sugar transport system permease protein